MNKLLILAILSLFIASGFSSCSEDIDKDLGLDKNEYYGDPSVTCGWSVYSLKNAVGEIAYEKDKKTYFFYLERGRYDGIDTLERLLDKKMRFDFSTDTIRQIINKTGKKVVLDANISFTAGVTHPTVISFDIRKYDKNTWEQSKDNEISCTYAYGW